jgi:hypothetical protein
LKPLACSGLSLACLGALLGGPIGDPHAAVSAGDAQQSHGSHAAPESHESPQSHEAPGRHESPESHAQRPASGAELEELRFGTQAEVVDGEVWVTVRTEEAPLGLLLAELGREAQVEFEGLERLPPALRVSADLEHRPLRQVVGWILGSVGLRADRRMDTFTLHVDADTREDLQAQAQIEYLRTLREFPNHPLADRALYGQALLEEDRGEPGTARAHYDALVEAYPESELVGEALKRCAELFAADRDWSRSAQKWAQLLRLEQETEFEILAYEQLALCTAQLGDAERALYMLDALDESAPAREDGRQERLYIRARALVGQGQHHRALEALAEADESERSRAQQLDSHELRARALGGLEEHGAASRSWLAYCEVAAGDDLARGLQQAATSALLAGDELAVLFIERLATRRGVEGVVAEQAREARTRLDLLSGRLSGQVDVERLARAERLLAAGLFAEASELLADLSANAHLFEEDERARFVLAYGRALGAGGSEAALAFLKEQLASLTEVEHRTEVYLLAAELLEAEGRMDEAIEAYQGRL